MSRFDIHHHMLPPGYLAALAERGIQVGGGQPFLTGWDPQSSLDLMEQYDISRAMLSISDPGIAFGDALLARDLARLCNEYAAELMRSHPGRFGAFAVLPLPDVDGALRELEYALDTLRLNGVVLFSNSDGRYPGDALFDNLFTEFNRRKVVVFLHPTVPANHRILQLDLPPFLVEFVFDTTRAVVNLLYSGTLDRCPDIRFVLAHAGGTVPYLARRISMGQVMLSGVPQGAMTYLQQLYYDIALSVSPFTLRSLQELVDPSHILYGSDHPFAPKLLVDLNIRGLGSYDGFDDEARKLIERENALRLFPYFPAAK
jgi:predicted TIM-barrel fold metal-dependent hydrolase